MIIDNLEFAGKNETLAGEISMLSAERLAQLLPEKARAHIVYRLVGHHNKLRSPSLDLNIEAAFDVVCQRCLEPMPISLILAFQYLISDVEPAADDDTDDYDWLEPSRTMNLYDLIEDELLLALPISPVHAHQCTTEKMQSGAPVNPFAALKNWIK